MTEGILAAGLGASHALVWFLQEILRFSVETNHAVSARPRKHHLQVYTRSLTGSVVFLPSVG